MTTLLTIGARIKDWKALRELNRSGLVGRATQVGARRYQVYRDLNDAGNVLILVELPDQDAVRELEGALCEALSAVGQPGAGENSTRRQCWEPMGWESIEAEEVAAPNKTDVVIARLFSKQTYLRPLISEHHSKGETAMSTESNKAVVRRFYEQFTQATVDEVLTPDYTHHDPGLPPQMQTGREAYKQVVNLFMTGIPDMQTTVEDLVGEGDKVAARWIAHGHHQGSLMGIPATGKSLAIRGTSIHRFVNGQIAEAWVTFDALGMLQQLGVVPAPDQA